MVRKEYETLLRKATEDENFKFIPIKLDSRPLPSSPPTSSSWIFRHILDGAQNGGELIKLLHGIVGRPLDSATVKFANEQGEMANEAIAAINAAVRNGYPEDIIRLAETEILPWRTTPVIGM